MLRKRQFSLATVLVVVFVYAFAIALALSFSLPLMQVVVATLVLTLCVALDLLFDRHDTDTTPRLACVLIFVSRYATALSLSTLACLVVFPFSMESQIATPAQQASWLADAVEPLILVLLLIFAYLGVFSCFSTLAFVASLLVIRRFRLARWLALINLPGTALFCLFIVGIWFGEWSVSSANTARPCGTVGRAKSLQ